MKTFSYTITDESGIHARPAGMLVNKVKELDGKITIEKGGKIADAGKLFAVMGLGVRCGDTVIVTVNGGDEAASIAAMSEFFKDNL